MDNFIFPPDGFLFSTHTEEQHRFLSLLKNEGIDAALNCLDGCKNRRELSIPQSLTCHWPSSQGPYTFEYSLLPNFSESKKHICAESHFTLYNLLCDRVYYWRVNGGPIRSFRTDPSYPRFIHLDGAVNVRDMGDTVIRQGFLYRGSEMDGHFTLTEHGYWMLQELGIKTELDLRAESEDATVSLWPPFRICIPYRPYLESFKPFHKDQLRKIIALLADERRYPIYFHCVGGADRTGILALMIRGIMRESDEMIFRDYELTSLSSYAGGITEGAVGYRRRNSPYFLDFLNRLSSYCPNGGLSEQIHCFLSDCAVPQSDIDSVYHILHR